MTRIFRTSLTAGALVLACLLVPGAAGATVTVSQLQDHIGPAVDWRRRSERGTVLVPGGRGRECRLVFVVRIHQRERGHQDRADELRARSARATRSRSRSARRPTSRRSDLPRRRVRSAPRAWTSGRGQRYRYAAATSFPGFVYNAEPLADEPGRLGVVTPSPLGPRVLDPVPRSRRAAAATTASPGP